MAGLARDIAELRRFNRFYTVEAGLLAEGLLKSAFSLTEARVLYELAQRDEATATDLKRELHLDPGYLSRILKHFSTRGFLARTADKEDGRKALLRLTAAGRKMFAGLDRASSEDARGRLAGLAARDRAALIKAMRTIEQVLGPAAPPTKKYALRPLEVGDIGWIAHRQGVLYAQEYGWDVSYEALVAEILTAFVRKFDPDWERAWIAERNGEVVGSVFIVRLTKSVAKLRLLYVEPSARGLGLGRRLVEECVSSARGKGYAKMTLWTQSNLTAARHIYETAGFRRVAEEKHHSFGKDLVGETWEIGLKT